ncbi:amidohydrolase family protein [Nonomuraea jabiensis]|uniref:amidohydrolase family protein n=1 Tax=Nonomuraea jabiensis TaxID=882448 RepID=UPI003433DF3C
MGGHEATATTRREFVHALAIAGLGMALPHGPEMLVLTGATVIDGTGSPPRPDQIVVMAGGTIVRMGDRRQAMMPEGAQVIDVRGKYLIPGLWDMHTHMTSTADNVYPPLYIANGVTGVREMWGDAALHALRTRIEDGTLLGPRLVIASAIIDGPHSVWPDATPAATPAEGRAAVGTAKAEGADFVKTYSFLDRDTLTAIIDEGRRSGLPVAGHLPWRVPARQASDDGMRSLEHLFGLPIAASSAEAEILRTLARTPIDPARPRQFYDLARELDRQASLAHDPSKAAQLFDRLARNGTWQTPTLTILRVASSPADTYADDPRLKYVPQDVRAYWRQRIAELAPSTPEQIAQQRDFLGYRLRMVGEMHRAGVGLIGGTDVPNPYVFPGFSAHDELALLVEAGLSPMVALRAMTGEATRFLGLGHTVGTLEAGKAADLVILDADPLRDIHNTRKIHAVVVRGRLLDRRRLDTMLAEVEAAVANPLASGPSSFPCC